MPNISKKKFYAFIVLSVIILFFCLRADRWFPLVDSANLAFHEFGHPFFGIFNERLMVYGGTLGQLIFPIAIAVYFYRRQETFSFAVAILWIAENFLNIATYMRDARAQNLPLVGGGEHDWTEIFTRWGCLQNDIKISDRVIFMTVLALLGMGYWLYTKTDVID